MAAQRNTRESERSEVRDAHPEFSDLSGQKPVPLQSPSIYGIAFTRKCISVYVLRAVAVRGRVECRTTDFAINMRAHVSVGLFSCERLL